MNPAAKKILSLFASLIIAIPLYIFLHEGGHALTALLCGAKITQFSIMAAYSRLFPSHCSISQVCFFLFLYR